MGEGEKTAEMRGDEGMPGESRRYEPSQKHEEKAVEKGLEYRRVDKQTRRWQTGSSGVKECGE